MQSEPSSDGLPSSSPIASGTTAAPHFRRATILPSEPPALSEITRSLITVTLLGLVAFQLVTGREVDNATYAILSAVIGFYFGIRQNAQTAVVDPTAGRHRTTDRGANGH